MATEKKTATHSQMTEGKRSLVRQLIQEYAPKTALDIQDALKDLLGSTLKEMLEAEMDNHLGYSKSERSDNSNSRNGYKTKQVRSSMGEFSIEVPQDRESTFQPQVVQKRQKDISEPKTRFIVTRYSTSAYCCCCYFNRQERCTLSAVSERVYPVPYIRSSRFSA